MNSESLLGLDVNSVKLAVDVSNSLDYFRRFSMPSKSSDEILRLKLHPGDECIGLDASVSHIPQGKRQINRDAKQISNVPIPLHNATFMCEMPYRNPNKDVRINTDALLWRSYRACIKPSEDQRVEGVKVYQKKLTSSKFQAEVRKGLREHLRQAIEKDQKLQEEHNESVSRQRDRQFKRGVMDLEAARARATRRGFEGIRRPTVGSPAPDPEPNPEEVKRLMSTPLFGRTSGKKMVLDHVSGHDHGRPFGAQLRSESEPMRRWQDKSLT